MFVRAWVDRLSSPQSVLATGVVVACLALGAASGRAEIISPTALIAGQSQLEHSHLWWQTMVNFPLANNPITDTTGSLAHLGQQPGNVLYLAGSFGPSSSRSTSVPPGTILFFPLINGFWENTAPIGSPPTNLTPQEMLDIINQDNPVSLFLEIDGQPVATMAQLLLHRQTTDPNNPFAAVIQSPANLYVDVGYDPTLGTGDPFDPASYPTILFPSVADGYWIGLGPFAPGSTHTIHFGGLLPNGFSQDNTFVITTTPEPTSWLVWGAVMSGLAFVAYRRGLASKQRGTALAAGS